MASEVPDPTPARRGISWGKVFGRGANLERAAGESGQGNIPTWSMGILNDKETVEVPGSVLLLAAHRNEPLGLRNVHARTSHSSIPAGFPVDMPMTPGGTRPAIRTSADHSTHSPSQHAPVPEAEEDKKTTDDGTIILEPQPEESGNDPLNWPGWRRDVALLSLGFYCMIGGGITPLIAAGFTNVAQTYHISESRVPLTTGLYMMGLGVGSVIFSPTAILWGKRPVYLLGALLFICSAVWCALSPSFTSLLVARVFQGIAVSPVECLPSATIAEIFFLHERAFRIGIYTLLLLGGKNLVPLVSASIIGSFGWRWVFWIVAMIAGLGMTLLFLFVPETFWDRTPTRKPSKRPSFLRRLSSRPASHKRSSSAAGPRDGFTQEELTAPTPRSIQNVNDDWRNQVDLSEKLENMADSTPETPGAPTPAHHKNQHVGFADLGGEKPYPKPRDPPSARNSLERRENPEPLIAGRVIPTIELPHDAHPMTPPLASPTHEAYPINSGLPRAHESATGSASNLDYFHQGPRLESESIPVESLHQLPKVRAYTHNLRQQPPRSFLQQLRPFHGRLNNDKWLKVMIRPFILYAYPAVLWSSLVYACSIGWLIVLSENLAQIYRTPERYNFTALQAGLVYVSPFIGGILGTGVAGKISDIMVKAMAARNGGLYEPEFRLIMAAPIMITTGIGLMGFGWSAQDDDAWIVPTLFFGLVSFGCALGSTTSITFCVDSYRQYAGEALVTLNFTKNICHGLVFSLFISKWLTSEGPKMVYIWIGVIQLIILSLSIPMYIFGKRARMWTVRMNFMEKF